MQDEIGARWAGFRLPWLYGPAVTFWLIVFGGTSISLAILYIGFVLSGATELAAAFARGEGESSKYLAPLIFLIAGGLLLAALVSGLVTRSRFSGVSVEPERFENLRALIGECAEAAGIAPPEVLYLTPDMTVAAYSAGRLSLTREGKKDAVFIGAGALLLVSRSDLKAILLHEFAHIAVRRKVLAVDVCNKIYNFVPRFARAHHHALAAIVTLVPLIVFRVLWWGFRKSMEPLSREEELLVDRCAAEVTSNRDYTRALARFAVLHRAMQVSDPDTPALLSLMNADFYQALLGSSDARETLNWFATARRTLLERREILWLRIEAAKDWHLSQPRSESGTHPSLRTRAEELSQNLNALMDAQGLWERAQTFEDDFEERLSKEFATKLRPWFYAASKEAGEESAEGAGSDMNLEFVCQRKTCARSGRPELSLSDSELRLYGKHKPTIIKWTEVAESRVITKTEGFLTEMAVNIMAELRESPSNRTLLVHLKSGRKIVVPHWHCGANAIEIEGWIEHYVGITRLLSGATGPSTIKSGRLTGRGLATAFVVVILVLFPLVFLSVGVSSQFGQKYGSAVQTVLIIALIAWFMGRRR